MRGKPANVRVAQALAEELENDNKASKKFKIPDIKEEKNDHVKELAQSIKSMQDEHKNQVVVMQNYLVNMKESHENELQDNNDQSWPYYSTCEIFHDESTCAFARAILGSGIGRTSNQINHFDDEKENDKHLVKELTQIIKYMQSSQARLIADHAREMSSMGNRLQAIEVAHYNQRIGFQNMMDTIEEGHAKKLEIMQTNHSKQMTTMQDHLITMDENHAK